MCMRRIQLSITNTANHFTYNTHHVVCIIVLFVVSTIMYGRIDPEPSYQL